LIIGKGHGFSQAFQPFLGYLPSVQVGSPIFIVAISHGLPRFPITIGISGVAIKNKQN
jgi:hypothetical protein